MRIKFVSTHIESGEKYPYEGNDKKINYKDSVLSPNTEYTVKITYPLTNYAKFKFSSGKAGITRQQLSDKIRQFYKKVYKEENESTKIKPGNIPNMWNRNETNGKYVIWGHDIGDLVLVYAEVDKNNVIELGVDS